MVMFMLKINMAIYAFEDDGSKLQEYSAKLQEYGAQLSYQSPSWRAVKPAAAYLRCR